MMYSQDENRPPASLDATGDDGVASSRNRPRTLVGGGAAAAGGCISVGAIGNSSQPPPSLVMGGAPTALGNSGTPLSPMDNARFPAESSPFSSSDAEDRFKQKLIDDQFARETIEVCSRFFKRHSSAAPRDGTRQRRKSQKKSIEKMKTSPSIMSSSCGDSMHSASSRSRTATSSQQSAGTGRTSGTANLPTGLTVPVVEESMSKSQERLKKFSQQIEALRNQTQPLTKHTKQSSDTSAAIAGWRGATRAKDCTELTRGPKPTRALSDPSVNRVSAAAAFNNATHSQSQDPSSFSIPRVSTNESSSSTAATTSAFPQQQQQISKVSTGAGHGIGGAVHPPSQPTAIPALTSNRPHERLSDSLSRPQNQTDENKFQKFVRKNLDKLKKSKVGANSENGQRRRQKSDPVSHRYSTTAVNSLPRNGHLLSVENQSNTANSQPNTAPGSTGTLSRRNSMSSRLLNRLNISQLFDNRVPGYEADSEYFQQQQEAARKKRYQKRSKLDSSREASISNYEDPPVRPDMVGAELMKTSAKKQAGSKSHLAGPPLAYADSFPSTSKNSNGGMFKKFKKGSSNLLRSRKSVKGQGPGDKVSVTSSELSSLRGTLPLTSSTLDSLRSTTQFNSHPASPVDRNASSRAPFHFHVTPPPQPGRSYMQTEDVSRLEDYALSNDTADDVFNSNGHFGGTGVVSIMGSPIRGHTAGPPLASLDSPFEESIEVNINGNASFRDEPPAPSNEPDSSQPKNNCCPAPLNNGSNRKLSSTSESRFTWIVDRMIQIADENQDVVDQIVQNVGATLPDPADVLVRIIPPPPQDGDSAAASQEGLGAVGGIDALFPGTNPPRRKPSLPLCSSLSRSNLLMTQFRNSSTYEEFRNIFNLIMGPLNSVVDTANSYYSGSPSQPQEPETSAERAGPSTSSSPGARNDNNNSSPVPGLLSTFLSVIYVIVGTDDGPIEAPLASNLLLYIQEYFGRELHQAGGYESLFSDHHTTDDNELD